MKAHAAIGARLRAAREERGLTLKALADSMGVTSSLLSQIETDKVQPSLNTLYQLATRLDLSVDDLLGLSSGKPTAADPAVVIQHASENPSLEMSGGVRWERLASRSGLGLEPLRVTYPPGAASSADQEMLATTGFEFGVVLSGKLTLSIGFETHVLGAGDSVFFDRTRPHVYINESDAEAGGVWFVIRSLSSITTDSPRGAHDATQISSLIDVLRVLDASDDW
ncbi:helix-turn-helix domain-containing protein [Streptomyces sp. 6N223]|uniref:helix-turn-helix domain-containing protein n=1 Tax=Streptomyces sp. 6N223 TaxID=3457412 RepID=UPI003FD5B9A6